jgi:hypothetical protein
VPRLEALALPGPMARLSAMRGMAGNGFGFARAGKHDARGGAEQLRPGAPSHTALLARGSKLERDLARLLEFARDTLNLIEKEK